MARPPLHPNPENCTQAELDGAIRAAVSAASVRRMQAIKALLMGAMHGFVAELFSVDAQTLRVWVKAFNRQGIDGLTEKPKPGRPRAIDAAQTQQLVDLLHHPDKAQIAHWTAKKFHGHITEQLQCEVGYSTLVRWMHEQNFVLKVPQPWPDRQDENQRQAWLKQLRALLSDDAVDVWYMDEMGVEGDPRPRRRWAVKWSKVRVTRNGDHLRMNVTGMICPRSGEAFLLEFSHNDREVFQAFLDQANRLLKPARRRNILICDNASWHKCKSNVWGLFEPMFLPAYSPDFNPIERLWLLIKAHWFSDFVAKSREALIERLDQALLWAMGRQGLNQQTCRIP